MQCPRCKAPTQVLRTDPHGSGKRRSRRCLGPECGYRFNTVEDLHHADPAPPKSEADYAKMIGALKDGRGYDRMAVIAAISTDRRRAQIAAQQRALRDAADAIDYDSATPARLSPERLRSEFGL